MQKTGFQSSLGTYVSWNYLIGLIINMSKWIENVGAQELPVSAGSVVGGSTLASVVTPECQQAMYDTTGKQCMKRSRAVMNTTNKIISVGDKILAFSPWGKAFSDERESPLFWLLRVYFAPQPYNNS